MASVECRYHPCFRAVNANEILSNHRSCYTSSLAGCVLHGGDGVKVCVKNDTDTTLNNVQVIFAGGVVTTTAITPGEQKIFDVLPTGESHLVLRFSDPLGQKHETPVDVYFESGYRGTITVTIDGRGTVSWKDDLKVR
jgi:hypothetical protein